jgi:hypothetical protein
MVVASGGWQEKWLGGVLHWLCFALVRGLVVFGVAHSSEPQDLRRQMATMLLGSEFSPGGETGSFQANRESEHFHGISPRLEITNRN